MKLYLIRHAESEANAASDLDNPTYYYDARITQRGVEQAKKLNNRIQNLKFDSYFCSPLTRTLETFSIVFPSWAPSSFLFKFSQRNVSLIASSYISSLLGFLPACQQLESHGQLRSVP